VSADPKPGSLEWMVTVAYPAMFALYQVINDPELLALVASAGELSQQIEDFIAGRASTSNKITTEVTPGAGEAS
jgi:hypothetical protein